MRAGTFGGRVSPAGRWFLTAWSSPRRKCRSAPMHAGRTGATQHALGDYWFTIRRARGVILLVWLYVYRGVYDAHVVRWGSMEEYGAVDPGCSRDGILMQTLRAARWTGLGEVATVSNANERCSTGTNASSSRSSSLVPLVPSSAS